MLTENSEKQRFKFELAGCVYSSTNNPQMSDPTPPIAHSAPTAKRGVVGLRNLGNTCYANSAIQALRQITEMTYLCLTKDSDLKKTSTTHSGKLFDAYKDLIQTLWSNNHPAFITPNAFWSDMLAAADKAGYEHFRGREPQDAHEFMMFLLDQIFEGTKEQVHFVIQRPPVTNDRERRIQSALESWKANFEKQYTPIVDIWFGLLECETECQTCKNKTYRYETFNSLKFTVPAKLEEGQVPPTIHEMLHEEWKPETIEGYDCEKCVARTQAIRQSKIWRLPRCLILVFKRFLPNGQKVQTNWTWKEENFMLKEFFSMASPEKSQEFVYGVQSIVDHHGSARGGHYTAQGLNPIDNHWYFYDDENSGAMEKPVFGRTNYMLLMRAKI